MNNTTTTPETTTTPAPEIIIFRQNQNAKNKRAKYQFAHVVTVPATDEEENSLNWTDAANVKALKEIAREAGKHLFNLCNFSRIESTPEPTPEPTSTNTSTETYTMTNNTHFVAIDERTSANELQRLTDGARVCHGKYQSNPQGFVFKDKIFAEKFASVYVMPEDEPTPDATEQAVSNLEARQNQIIETRLERGIIAPSERAAEEFYFATDRAQRAAITANLDNYLADLKERAEANPEGQLEMDKKFLLEKYRAALVLADMRRQHEKEFDVENPFYHDDYFGEFSAWQALEAMRAAGLNIRSICTRTAFDEVLPELTSAYWNDLHRRRNEFKDAAASQDDPTDEHAARAEYNDALAAWHSLGADAMKPEITAASERLRAAEHAINSIEGTPEHAQAQAHATLLQKLKERDKASAVNQAPENVRAAFFVVMRGTAPKYSHRLANQCALYNKAREMFVYTNGVATEFQAPREMHGNANVNAHQNNKAREAHEQAAKLCHRVEEEFAHITRGEMPRDWQMLREITGRKQAARTVENWMNNPTPAPSDDEARRTADRNAYRRTKRAKIRARNDAATVR